MKNALFLVLTICTALTTAHAQYGDRRDDRRNDKFIDSDALENMAIQGLENDLKRLVQEIRTNNNYDYNPNNRGGVRGNGRGAMNSVDVLTIALSMESSARSLRTLTRGERTRRSQPGIDAETRSLKVNAANMINAIPSLTRGSANLIDNLLEVIKSVGAIELALRAPRSAGAPIGGGNNGNGGGYNPQPSYPVYAGRAGYCSLSFSNSWGSDFLVSGEGNNSSQATANLYSNCGNLSGSSGNVSNAAVCQSKIGASKCLDVVEYSRSRDAHNRFSACTLSFTNSWGSAFSANGAGPTMFDAIAGLWDSCKNISGSAGNVNNAEVCRQAVALEKFSCTVR